MCKLLYLINGINNLVGKEKKLKKNGKIGRRKILNIPKSKYSIHANITINYKNTLPFSIYPY